MTQALGTVLGALSKAWQYRHVKCPNNEVIVSVYRNSSITPRGLRFEKILLNIKILFQSWHPSTMPLRMRSIQSCQDKHQRPHFTLLIPKGLQMWESFIRQRPTRSCRQQVCFVPWSAVFDLMNSIWPLTIYRRINFSQICKEGGSPELPYSRNRREIIRWRGSQPGQLAPKVSFIMEARYLRFGR